MFDAVSMAAMFGSDIAAVSGLRLEWCRSINGTHSLGDTVSRTNHGTEKDHGLIDRNVIRAATILGLSLGVVHGEMTALNIKFTRSRNSI